MKKRVFELHGYQIEVYDFGYKQYMYPYFNGNAEFEVTSNGFRKLSHYIRTCIWINKSFN